MSGQVQVHLAGYNLYVRIYPPPGVDHRCNSQVWGAHHHDSNPPPPGEDPPCVIKMVNQPVAPEKQESVRREVELGLRVSHPNVVKLQDILTGPGVIGLIMPYAPYGSLDDCIKQTIKRSLLQDEAAYVLRQLCEGLKYLHSQNIIHRDVKPENFLIQNCLNTGRRLPSSTTETPQDLRWWPSGQISDFGLSKEVYMTNCTTNRVSVHQGPLGTTPYMALEMLTRNGQCPLDDFSVDDWSLGILAYHIQTGEFPSLYESAPACTRSQQEIDGRIDNHLPEGWPREVTKGLLRKIKTDRMCATQALQLIPNLDPRSFTNCRVHRSASGAPRSFQSLSEASGSSRQVTESSRSSGEFPAAPTVNPPTGFRISNGTSNRTTAAGFGAARSRSNASSSGGEPLPFSPADLQELLRQNQGLLRQNQELRQQDAARSRGSQQESSRSSTGSSTSRRARSRSPRTTGRGHLRHAAQGFLDAAQDALRHAPLCPGGRVATQLLTRHGGGALLDVILPSRPP